MKNPTIIKKAAAIVSCSALEKPSLLAIFFHVLTTSSYFFNNEFHLLFIPIGSATPRFSYANSKSKACYPYLIFNATSLSMEELISYMLRESTQPFGV